MGGPPGVYQCYPMAAAEQVDRGPGAEHAGPDDRDMAAAFRCGCAS